jgi:hypothetical protein
MDFKKVGVCSILTLLLSIYLMGFVAAADTTITVQIMAGTDWRDAVPNAPNWAKTVFDYAQYIFGQIPTMIFNAVGGSSALVVTLAIWALILVTFGDILTGFSTFSRPISWVVALLIAIIAANIKLVIMISTAFAAIFISLGVLGVWLGILGAIIAFVVVNLGITRAGKWIMRRKVIMESARGRTTITEAVKTLGDIGRETQNQGSKGKKGK